MSPRLLNKTIACCLALLLTAPASQAFASARPGPQSEAQTPAQTQSAPPPNSSNGAQTAPGQTPANNPVGTAVAPYEGASGITGSRPAGAVIAPGKQRRVRSILIKIGVVVGAAAAVGTVVALSHASPSQPH